METYRLERAKIYDGHHNFHCSCAKVCVDVFEMIIHVHFTNEDRDHERSIFSDSMIIRDQDNNCDDKDNVLGDTEF